MSTTLIIDGHPNPGSLCGALARAYRDGNPAARLIALRDLDFDLNLRFGYAKRIVLEPDLVDTRAAIRKAAHLVFVTPVWWRSVPALLKGFCDRALLPQEDYRHRPGGLTVGLLRGRSARVIITADWPVIMQPLLPGNQLRGFTHGTLALCGLGPVRTTRLAPVSTSKPEQRAAWLERVRRIATTEAAHVRTVGAPSAKA